MTMDTQYTDEQIAASFAAGYGNQVDRYLASDDAGESA